MYTATQSGEGHGPGRRVRRVGEQGQLEELHYFVRAPLWLGTHRSNAKQHFVAERTVSTLLSTGAKGASKAW